MLGIIGDTIGKIPQKPGSQWPMTGASLGRCELCASIQASASPRNKVGARGQCSLAPAGGWLVGGCRGSVSARRGLLRGYSHI